MAGWIIAGMLCCMFAVGCSTYVPPLPAIPLESIPPSITLDVTNCAGPIEQDVVHLYSSADVPEKHGYAGLVGWKKYHERVLIFSVAQVGQSHIITFCRV